MRSSTLVMVGLALVFGVAAVFVAQFWLDRQASLRLRQMQADNRPVATRTVVVAAVPLRFGLELGKQHLREVAWPDGAVPAGAFGSVSEFLGPEGKRVVLAAMEPNEPVLRSKVTGPGQRGTLSAVIREGMKAVTLRVNDVFGVAGFVLPGDRVDVLLTRQSERGDGYTDVLLQNVRVLGVDQVADERADKPSVVKAVTLEVGTSEAQKVALAGSVGSLSLTLRRAGESAVEATRRIGLGDLGAGPATLVAETGEKNRLIPSAHDVAGRPAPEPGQLMARVGVMRASVRQDYDVPQEATP